MRHGVGAHVCLSGLSLIINLYEAIMIVSLHLSAPEGLGFFLNSLFFRVFLFLNFISWYSIFVASLDLQDSCWFGGGIESAVAEANPWCRSRRLQSARML